VIMSSLSRELVFLILQFLEEEKFKETVHRYVILHFIYFLIKLIYFLWFISCYCDLDLVRICFVNFFCSCVNFFFMGGDWSKSQGFTLT
jgi:hypothetical protein